MPITYRDLETRYGEAVAQHFVKEIEKAARIRAENDNWDFEARLVRAQRAQDQQRH